MEVICHKQDGYLLSPKEVRNGKETMTHYEGISLGRKYLVYGISLYEEGINYLLYDDFSMPNWYPAELFDVTDSRIPVDWHYKYSGNDESLTAIWGYEELVHSETHYDDICEQEVNAVQLFIRRKIEIETWMERCR